MSVLVEKDWCAFGHKFEDRCGHGNDSSHLSDERSPVFFQFLDVVYQILCQFPSSFEYNENLLLLLADHVYSCMYGNFLGNSMMERERVIEVKAKTRSLWGYVIVNQTLFKNDGYDKRTVEPIWPSLSPKQIKVWDRYFNRWDPTCHPFVNSVATRIESKLGDENTDDSDKGKRYRMEEWEDSWICHDKWTTSKGSL